MFELIIVIIICIAPFIKKVPYNTVVIIDRNGHYLKTKHSGWYILWPSDEVTTTISTSPLQRSLTDYFETDDGKLVQATIFCRYQAHNLTNVLQALENVRRSVDDIIKSSAHFAISNYPINHIMGINNQEFTEKVRSNLIDEFNSIGITLSNMRISVSLTQTYGKAAFRPHESRCYRSNQTPHSHDTSLMIGDKFKNGPIIYK